MSFEAYWIGAGVLVIVLLLFFAWVDGLPWPGENEEGDDRAR